MMWGLVPNQVHDTDIDGGLEFTELSLTDKLCDTRLTCYNQEVKPWFCPSERTNVELAYPSKQKQIWFNSLM